MSIKEMTYQVRKHGELIVDSFSQAQRLQGYAQDEHAYTFGIQATVAGVKVIDLDD